MSVISYIRNEQTLPGSIQQKICVISQGKYEMKVVLFLSKIYQIITGISSSLLMTTALASMTYMAVPDALCIVFASPLVTIILSAVVLGDKLTFFKIIAGLHLLLGVILVCKPPLLFGTSDYVNDRDFESYNTGVLLAVIACLSGGSMNVLVSKCKHVSSNILVSWSAVSGVLMSVIYCFLEGTSNILSHQIYHTTWMQWNTFIGEYIFFKSYSLKSYSCRFICVWDDSIYNPDPVSSVNISQSCCQSQVSGTGAGILCPVSHHQIHAGYDHLYWRDSHHSWSLHPSNP